VRLLLFSKSSYPSPEPNFILQNSYQLSKHTKATSKMPLRPNLDLLDLRTPPSSYSLRPFLDLVPEPALPPAAATITPQPTPPPDCTSQLAALQSSYNFLSSSAALKIAVASSSLQVLLISNIAARQSLSSANAAIRVVESSASGAVNMANSKAAILVTVTG